MTCQKCPRIALHFDEAELIYCESKDQAAMKFTLHPDASMGEEVIHGDDNAPGLTLVLYLSCGICGAPRIQEVELWSPYG